MNYQLYISTTHLSDEPVKRVYTELSGEANTTLTSKDIFDIAEERAKGNEHAAIRSFEELGEVLGCFIAQALNMADVEAVKRCECGFKHRPVGFVREFV